MRKALTVLLVCSAAGLAQQPSSVVKPVGTVKVVTGNVITLTTDAGAAVNVAVAETTRIMRVSPGQKDLREAAPAKLEDVQAGDRVLARGIVAADGSVQATAVIIMKGADIAAKQEQDRDDWQRRGVGGLVTAVDSANGNISISISTLAGVKTVTVHVAKETVIRRYAPDSVKFDEAKAGTLDQIKVGDQLRARGNKNADGSEIAAGEIVSGTFRNIAGTVISADSSKQEISVMDLATKKPVELKIAQDSQLRELPAMMAQRIAMRMKGGEAGANSQVQTRPGPAEPSSGRPGAPRMGGGRGDFQQLLTRLPAVSIGDLQKGTVVMIVATEGTAENPPTAITLLTGVDPILAASPKGGQPAMMLSPWNLNGAGGDSASGNP